jgi:hypothetical protein
MQELRQSTEVKVPIGPFVDVGDGLTPQTDITLAGNEAELIKHNAATVTDISGATWAAIADCRGWYNLTLTAGYTDTLGMLTVVVQDDSDCIPVHCRFAVVTQNYWDSKYSTDKLQVDVTQLGGATQSATDLKDFVDTGYDPSTHKVQGVVLTDTTTTNSDLVAAADVVAAIDADPPGVDLTKILGTTLTETEAGYLAAAFKKLFDVATPVATAASVNQSGDCFPNIALSVALEVMRGGLSFFGIVTAIDGANHKFTIPAHTVLSQGTFIDGTAPYRAFVMFDAGGAGAAPQGETQNVTGFVAATGEYTTDAFTTPVGIGDYVIIMHPRIAELADVRADVTAILGDTGTDGVVLANDAITSAKYDESTAFPIKSADADATQIARTGADSDTLETLSDEIATNATAIADVIDRIGAFTKSGGNTVWGFLKGICSKAASTPSDIGGTFSAATDSLESISEAEAADEGLSVEITNLHSDEGS